MPIRPLNAELDEVSRTQLGENPQRLQNAIQEIKDWLAGQPHLRANTDEQWLASYIRGSKFNFEKVKQRLDLFYTCRGTAPEFFQLQHKDDTFTEMFSKGFYLPLPKLNTPGAPRITLIRPGVIELNRDSIIKALSVTQIIEKIMILDDDNSIVAGNINVVDLEGFNTLFGVFQMTTIQYKKIIACQQDSVPFRTQYTAFINMPDGMELLLGAILGLLNESNQNNFHVYGAEYEKIYEKSVPKEVMPVEYGGDGGTLQEIIDHWKEKIIKYDEWLENDLQCGADESKRPGGPKTTVDMFGVDRSVLQGSCVSFFDLFKA